MRDPFELALEQAETIATLEQRLATLEQMEAMSIRDPAIALPLSISYIQSLVGLRGFWPGGPVGITGASQYTLIDISGHGQHFLDRNEPPTEYFSFVNPIPLTRFNGTGEWFKITDQIHWDILGTEASIGAAYRGLTMGAYVNFDNTASSAEYILSKRLGGTQMSYWIHRQAGGNVRFGITNNGTTAVTASSVTTLLGSTWHLVIGRFDPSAEMSVFHNGVWEVNTTSIPASIYSGTADLFLAGRDDNVTPGQDLLDGKIALPWICAARIPDAPINRLWNISRHIFGI